MTNKYKPASPHDRLRIPAATYNAMLEAAKAHESRKFDQRHETEPETRQSDIVRILNASGQDLDRFAVVELTAPLIDPGDNLSEFQRRPAFRGGLPTADARGKFGILMEAIPNDRIGRAWISGACPVEIDITNEDHQYADAEDGTHEYLVSADFGSARIIWQQPGLGRKWALVHLSNESQRGANWEAKTPADGIPAKDPASDTIPSALCDVYYMTESGGTITRTAALVNGQPLQLRIGNRSTVAIGGDRFVSATRYVGGALIVTFDECDE